MVPDNCVKNNIILIGMPAVGKSTLGVLLAKRLGYAFIDTDLLIQTGEGAGLEHIIKKVGIDSFSDLEATYVQQLHTRNTVIATGGSVVYRPSAMAHLHSLGAIVFLDIQLAPLTQRLGEVDARGVLYRPGQTIANLYAERCPLYRKYAQFTVDCTHCTQAATVHKILTVLGKPSRTGIR